MPTMLSELYDALKEAGVSEEHARKAAEAVVTPEQRLAILEGKIDTFRVEVEGKIDTLRAEVQGEMTWMRWMVGTVIAIVLAILWRLLK